MDKPRGTILTCTTCNIPELVVGRTLRTLVGSHVEESVAGPAGGTVVISPVEIEGGVATIGTGVGRGVPVLVVAGALSTYVCSEGEVPAVIATGSTGTGSNVVVLGGERAVLTTE